MDEQILAAAFPGQTARLMQLCKDDPDLREMCDDYTTLARLMAQIPNDDAVSESLVELKCEIDHALKRGE